MSEEEKSDKNRVAIIGPGGLSRSLNVGVQPRVLAAIEKLRDDSIELGRPSFMRCSVFNPMFTGKNLSHGAGKRKKKKRNKGKKK